MASYNPVTVTDRSRDSKRKLKKKSHLKHHQQDSVTPIKWKSQTQQHIYSSKLHQALTTSPPPRGFKAVREAADRVLAATAKGRTRWSRAILIHRLKFGKRKNKRQKLTTAATGISRWRKPRVSVLRLKGKGLPAVQRKMKFLGRLVPGCRKESLPVILEETIDYIPALEMQIRAMNALFNLLSASGDAASVSTTAPPS
ncbi:putative transcription factor bHLH family [Lupinus albus]|uniref:Putative transcription factor bHLH family n=1 Tax=Lupinus albus TaxID=3870 RepID=A0A6A4PM01_LUPAL|nr:putative transcription factor bHLH family [Lupinus albus]